MAGELKQLVETMNGITEAFDVFRDTQTKRLDKIQKGQDALQERIEIIESNSSSAGRTAPVGGGAARAPEGYKVFHLDNGEKVYQLDSKTKIADVIRHEKAPPVSLDRWLAAALLGNKCRDKEALEYARELKDLTTTTSGVLIPAEYQGTWHDLMRAQSVLNACGMQTAVMTQKTQQHSVVTGDPATGWHTEEGSIAVGNPTFEGRTLTARTLVARCRGSLELSQDSPNFGQQLAQVMTRAMAAEIDRVGLIGSGTAPEPQGIRGASGVTQTDIGSPSASDGYFGLLDGVKSLLDNNVPLEEATRNIVMSPGAWLVMESQPTGISGDNTQLPRPRALQDTNFRITSVLTDTGSPAGDPVFLGDFRELVLGTRMEATVEALKLSTYASNLQIEYIGVARVDFMIVRPASFVVLENFVTSG